MSRFLFLFFVGFALSGRADTTISRNGITWTLSGSPQHGVFWNGDPWVVGPATVVHITNTHETPGFPPEVFQSGSMLSPTGKDEQGYDGFAKNYRAELNVWRERKPVELRPGDALISTVSWSHKEPQCPRMYGTGTPRPALKAAAVLTCLEKPASPRAFRPGYCDREKNARFTLDDLRWKRLQNLPQTPNLPDMRKLAASLSQVWIDHVPNWSGAVFHPTENMPEYGRDMGYLLVQAMLVAHVDLPQEEKLPIVAGLVQLGLDLTSIAEAGGGWPADGGHGMGRKPVLFFAGALLENEPILSVGRGKTRFQDNEQTFFVTEKEVALTHSPQWNPDKRAARVPYTTADIGKPEWGIRHATEPERDNASWNATYREINNSLIPGFALAMRLLGVEEIWNHDAYFRYADRVVEMERKDPPQANRPPKFVEEIRRRADTLRLDPSKIILP